MASDAKDPVSLNWQAFVKLKGTMSPGDWLEKMEMFEQLGGRLWELGVDYQILVLVDHPKNSLSTAQDELNRGQTDPADEPARR